MLGGRARLNPQVLPTQDDTPPEKMPTEWKASWPVLWIMWIRLSLPGGVVAPTCHLSPPSEAPAVGPGPRALKGQKAVWPHLGPGAAM